MRIGRRWGCVGRAVGLIKGEHITLLYWLAISKPDELSLRLGGRAGVADQRQAFGLSQLHERKRRPIFGQFFSELRLIAVVVGH